ncbi:NAD(P)/FAD-dependent oxidoreductase [Rubrivirga sp. S365]|uniref:NADH:ubiquinone reductase (non-electrogenic) n=1 Tax=Rubrivirga litoralis TaxID=3075598 RepID=A0ABU3BTN5_9BACT|nr:MULTISPECIES: NAD(P)/FAD-dependent oxidoreductase [unclassified Rubrivirga]MDT0632652.1 NAD(P)/FAD-dependent oxidoreductase [Rubrivirga sp. F394]MDT7857171.1 NAD(P)/FAD-dependent oxidoreductase [Rubrivirga sp. S365]
MPRTRTALLAAGALGLGTAALRRWRRHPSPPPGGRPLRVVCVGAGFAGLRLAQELDGEPVELTLVDRNNYHLFQPLLYQVATAALEPEEIAHSVRGVLQGQANARFRMARATGVDWERRELQTAQGEPIPFDRLVIAAGAETASFGVPGVEEFAFGLKHLEDAVALRSHTIRRFERATLDPDEIDRGALTFVLVGGGPTGVEMSVALVELFDMVLQQDFPELDLSRARVILAEAGDSVLSVYDRDLRQYALDQIRKRGVEVRLGAAVERVEGAGGQATAAIIDGERVPAQTVLWAAGVQAAGLAATLGVEQGRGGRIAVEPDLSVPGHTGVYAVGDVAAGVEPLPQLAPVAQQQARYVARRLAAEARGEAPDAKPFRYTDKGNMATIGRGAAVAEVPGGIKLTGYVAWQAWAWLHLALLIGFRNRANVYVNWVYNYFTYDRSARLVLNRERVAGLLQRAVDAPPAEAQP